MKHIFIINPRAGRKGGAARLMDQIEGLRRAHGLTCETVLTARPGHAEEVARRAAESGEDVRLYACGGDGTLYEVANGAAGAKNAAVTAVPCGTGNDFLKNYGEDAARFETLEQLWNGPEHDLDLIECNGRVALTVACAGLDARVAGDVHRFSKRLPINGRAAYLLSAGANLCRSTGQRMLVSCGGQTTIGEYAMVCVCNGRYYGGGFMPIADARMDDGVLDTLIVRRLSRVKFLRLAPAYARGEIWRYAEAARRVQADTIRIQSREPFALSLDGEIFQVTDAQIALSDRKLRFFAPVGASCNRTARRRIEP